MKQSLRIISKTSRPEGVIVIPSRGYVFTQTVAAVELNVRVIESLGAIDGSRHSWSRVYTHSDSIPDAQNSLIRKALTMDPFKYIWMVEEDIVPPANSLIRLRSHLETEKLDFVCQTYLLEGGIWAHDEVRGRGLTICGFGSILFRKDVFERVAQPWFEANNTYSITQDGTSRHAEKPKYGGHDIDWFAAKVPAYELNWDVLLDPKLVCAHLRLVKRGAPGTNDGCHTIREVK